MYAKVVTVLVCTLCVMAVWLGVWIWGGLVCMEQAVINDVRSYYTSSGTCYNKDDNDWYEVFDNE